MCGKELRDERMFRGGKHREQRCVHRVAVLLQPSIDVVTDRTGVMHDGEMVVDGRTVEKGECG